MLIDRYTSICLKLILKTIAMISSGEGGGYLWVFTNDDKMFLMSFFVKFCERGSITSFISFLLIQNFHFLSWVWALCRFRIL